MGSGMVDISSKEVVAREAKACGRIYLKPSTVEAIRGGSISKGDVFEVTKAVALNAVKDTSRILPFCHPIPIEWIGFEHTLGDNYVEVCVSVKARAKTGVEMEALTGVLLALDNIWDMVKSLEKNEQGQYESTRIGDVRVVYKIKEAIA